MNRWGKRLFAVLLAGVVLAGSFCAGRLTGGAIRDIVAPSAAPWTQAKGAASSAPDGQMSTDAQGRPASSAASHASSPPFFQQETAQPALSASAFSQPDALSSLSAGDRGEAVAQLQKRLDSLGYSPGTPDGIFGKKTRSALEDFQRTAGLEPTGIADQPTQDLLYSAAALAYIWKPPSLSGEDAMVWIPRTGIRYHRRENCSNMKNPSYVALSEAIALGFTPCKKCYADR